MKQIFDIYRFVKIIDKMARDLEDEYPIPFSLTGYDMRYPATLVCKEAYVEQYNVKKIDANHANIDAISMGYLEGFTSNKADLAVDCLRITTKGRELIDKTWIIPIGLLYHTFEKYGRFITGFILGVVIPVVVWISHPIINAIF
jgi:hypothetical protein